MRQRCLIAGPDPISCNRLFGDRDEHRRGTGPFYYSRRGQRIDVPKEVASESQTNHACVDG